MLSMASMHVPVACTVYHPGSKTEMEVPRSPVFHWKVAPGNASTCSTATDPGQMLGSPLSSNSVVIGMKFTKT